MSTLSLFAVAVGPVLAASALKVAMPPNLQRLSLSHANIEDDTTRKIRCALLGCGMMGQEHISYIMGYPAELRIDFLCDPHGPSLQKSLKVMRDFQSDSGFAREPMLLASEDELLRHADEIDLLVVASPNFMHA